MTSQQIEHKLLFSSSHLIDPTGFTRRIDVLMAKLAQLNELLA
jgi:hypothetical protein